MATIYSKAAEVLVWLGPEADGSDEAMQAMYDGDQSVKRHVKPVSALFRRPYWTRLWIVQEILLARHTSILCGNRRCTWQALYEAASVCDNMIIQDWRPPQVVRDLYVTNIRFQKRFIFKTSSFHWHSVLERFGGQRCEDVRDKVYGLLGLVPQSEAIPVDYSKTASEIFFAVTRKIIDNEDWLGSGGIRLHALRLRDDMDLVEVSDADVSRFVSSKFVKELKEWQLEERQLDGWHKIGKVPEGVEQVPDWWWFGAET